MYNLSSSVRFGWSLIHGSCLWFREAGMHAIQHDGESCFLHGYTAPKQAVVSCAASSPVEKRRPLCTLDASVSTSRHFWDVHTCLPGHEVLQGLCRHVKKDQSQELQAHVVTSECQHRAVPLCLSTARIYCRSLPTWKRRKQNASCPSDSRRAATRTLAILWRVVQRRKERAAAN